MAPNEPEDPAAQARERFDDAYDLLRTGFEIKADRDRDEMSFEELVAEHETMESLRGDAHLAKKGVISRFEPPAHEHVDVPVGIPDASRTGRIFAAISALLMLGSAAAIWWAVAGNRAPIEVELSDEVVSSISDGTTDRCEWTIRVRISNGTDEAISIERAFVVLDRVRVRARIRSAPDAIPAGVADAPVVFAANVDRRADRTCPVSDELNHGSLTIEFERVTRSLRF